MSLVAGAALTLGGCVFGGGGDKSTATATPEVTPTVGATSEPTAAPPVIATPGPSGALPPGLEVSAPGTWERRDGMRFGDELPDILGVFIYDTDTGTGTLWSLDPASVADTQFVLVEASPGGQYVIARARPSHLVNTESGQSFTWGAEVRLQEIDDRGFALFTALRGCSFWLVDLSADGPRALASSDLPSGVAAGNCSIRARVSPDESELLVAVRGNNFSGGAGLFLTDVATGASRLLSELEPTSVTMTDRGPEGTVILTASIPGEAWIGEYTWTDRSLATVGIRSRLSADPDEKLPSPESLTVSPDGRWAAWLDNDGLGVGQGAGGESEWPVTVIANLRDGGPVVRAQRVTMRNGIVEFDWLADSSALAVQSEEGFALLGTDGSYEALPFPVAFHTDPVPVPAPDGAERFAYDGRVVDAAGNEVGEPPAVVEAWGGGDGSQPSSWWVRTSYGWGADSSQLVFVRTEVPGRDFGRGGMATIGLPPRIVTGPPAPFAAPVLLRVASDGDRLNVRVGPGIGAERLGQFEHGTVVTVVLDTSMGMCGPDGCSLLSDPELEYGDGWWIYVRDDQGLDGWVSAEFVEWAD